MKPNPHIGHVIKLQFYLLVNHYNCEIEGSNEQVTEAEAHAPIERITSDSIYIPVWYITICTNILNIEKVLESLWIFGH